MLETTGDHFGILSGLPDTLTSVLFKSATRRRLGSGEILFNAGDVADGCYRLDRGVLKINITSAQGEGLTLAIIGPGSSVGEPASHQRPQPSASVIAVKDCELSFISRAAFEECTTQYPEIYQSLVSVLATRLRQTDEAMAAATFLTVKARVARALLELAKHLGEDVGGGRILIPQRISHRDLAAMAGVARENVSRVLSKWNQQKILSRINSRYGLNDLARLERELTG